jgi:hypothetical protein
MISFNFTTAGLVGNSSKKFFPSSQQRANLGSRGTLPKNGTFISSHIFIAPPVVGLKIIDSP